VNSAGTSTYSSTVTSTPATVPDAPTALAGVSGNAQVPLTWTAPAATGGAAITDYIVQYRTSPAGAWNTFTDGVSTSPSTTVTGLTNGTAYDFHIAAVTSAGTGTYSATLTLSPLLPYNTVSGGSATRYASGGTWYEAHIFTASEAATVTSAGRLFDYVVVGGGGGGGGNYYNGGGGGGGFSSGSITIPAGSTAITVGAGGAGGASGVSGSAGGSSSIGSLVTSGGGGAGSGGTGGSVGTGNSGQSANGGNSGAAGGRTGGGGGGGAGQSGNAGGTVQGVGGNGTSSSITGTATVYGGGGGGAMNANNAYYVAAGGNGGGGSAAADYLGGAVQAVAGTANTGGGGGAGCWSNTTLGRAGGSGIVIIRYAWA
jgi:hypothetical protein